MDEENKILVKRQSLSYKSKISKNSLKGALRKMLRYNSEKMRKVHILFLSHLYISRHVSTESILYWLTLKFQCIFSAFQRLTAKIAITKYLKELQF